MDVHQRVGPYTLVRKLGEGGMGFVYLARDAAGRPVALKMMRPELAAREEFRRRFGKEAEAARRVARFCTAPVLDAGIEDGTAYLVTEYVEGPDLSGVVARQGPLTGSNLEALAVGVATALAAIHQAGVVHHEERPDQRGMSPGHIRYRLERSDWRVRWGEPPGSGGAKAVRLGLRALSTMTGES
ncbi:protein kinase [Nonomuraea sp. NPDC026600]|uniref:protein kinase domain-containing protein n=1 Tax=Nonomuraea sp. NPDC026600 TaxID=3155363 RepID=UPI00340648B2